MNEASTVGGVPDRVPLSALRLDWRNPRLPPEMQREDAEQKELALYIDKRYNPLEVAQSIARHGFFESEPLIAVEEGDVLVVVEGNRRLTALLGLVDGSIRSALVEQTKAWGRIVPQVPLPDLIPIVVVGTRSSVTPLLGFRHISGIKEWEPFAQARYIADLVDGDGFELAEVAELVGRPPLEIKAMYRDHEIVRQADEVFGLDTSRVIDDFGVFNAAMSIRNLRVYISAPTPANVNKLVWPLPDEAGEALDRLLEYIYGDARGRGRVLPESRMLRDLGRVLADPSGRAQDVLDKTRSLAEALDALTEPAELALKRLNAALNGLRRVLDEGPPELDDQCEAVIKGLVTSIEELQARCDRTSHPGGER